jgi:hypothetical protein
MSKPRAFWFHYNKPESARRGVNVLSLHHQGSCELVTDIVCQVPISSRHRNHQPRCVMAGFGFVTFDDLTNGGRRATITNKIK